MSRIPVVSGVNDLLTTAPQVAETWDSDLNGDLTPADVSKGMHLKVHWRCGQDHSWKAAVYSRSKAGCPYCANKKVLRGYNDLATTHPHLVDEWDFDQNSLAPDSIVAGTGERIHWKCELGHTWEARGAERKNGSTCPYCNGTWAWPGFNDLFTLFPYFEEEWDFISGSNTKDPLSLLPGSDYIAHWVCSIGHPFSQRVANRTVKGYGCPSCAGLQIVEGETDLFTVAPWVETLWDWSRNKVDPRKIGKGHHGSLYWVCEKFGHSYVSAVYNVVKGTRCGVCSGHQVLAGFNDLATIRPDLLLEWDFEKNKVLPSEISQNYSGKKVHWLCSLGHRWAASVAGRTNPNLLAGCPRCAGHGYDSTKEGLIYFLALRTGQARKVGITNPSNKTSRIGKLAKDGWDVLATWTGDGAQILAVETVFFAGMRFVDDIGPYFDQSDQVDGFSETFSADSIEGSRVKQSIEKLLQEPRDLLYENYGRRCRYSVLQAQWLP